MKKVILYMILLIFVLGIAGCGSAANESTEKSIDDLDKIPAFACKDLEGNDASEDIFSDSKITMVNIWTTR